MALNTDRPIELERARNLWASFVRKFEPHARSTEIDTDLDFDFDRIGGLRVPKEELLTYAYAAISPEVYKHWGTFPPSGLLLVGPQRRGKAPPCPRARHAGCHRHHPRRHPAPHPRRRALRPKERRI